MARAKFSLWQGPEEIVLLFLLTRSLGQPLFLFKTRDHPHSLLIIFIGLFAFYFPMESARTDFWCLQSKNPHTVQSPAPTALLFPTLRNGGGLGSVLQGSSCTPPLSHSHRLVGGWFRRAPPPLLPLVKDPLSLWVSSAGESRHDQLMSTEGPKLPP